MSSEATRILVFHWPWDAGTLNRRCLLSTWLFRQIPRCKTTRVASWQAQTSFRCTSVDASTSSSRGAKSLLTPENRAVPLDIWKSAILTSASSKSRRQSNGQLKTLLTWNQAADLQSHIAQSYRLYSFSIMNLWLYTINLLICLSIFIGPNIL